LQRAGLDFAVVILILFSPSPIKDSNIEGETFFMLQSAPPSSVPTGTLLAMITDAALLDQTVEEVLGLMMGVSVSLFDDPVTLNNTPVTLTAVIGLAGALSGAFNVVIDESGAKEVAACMMGMEIDTLDETVYDGLGEITNILAGAWKKKIPALSAACLLSVPTVVSGTNYGVHRKASTFRISRSYQFNDSAFTINLYGEQP
jgi:chemotaxis protein CheX